MLIGAAIAAKLWSDALGARERALATCRRACVAANVQLLDETVHLARLRPRRAAERGWLWERQYRFEFSISGSDRRRGQVLFLGLRMTQMELDADNVVH